jgi:hypothetical protein
MKAELQEKLFKEFPLLYGDRNKPMAQTCMCWGIATGDGWFDIIYELSSKLEPLIQKVLDDNPNLECSYCLCQKNRHAGSLTKAPGKCLSIRKVPLWTIDFDTKPPFVLKKRFSASSGWTKIKFYSLCNGFVEIFNRTLKLFQKTELQCCHCEQYEGYHPRALQVKEKYGTLRFYMTTETDEMSSLIDEAELKSAVVCEDCGSTGKLRGGGWARTLCDDCNYNKYKVR